MIPWFGVDLRLKKMDFAPFPESELLPTDSGQATAKGPCLGIAPVSYESERRRGLLRAAGALRGLQAAEPGAMVA